MRHSTIGLWLFASLFMSLAAESEQTPSPSLLSDSQEEIAWRLFVEINQKNSKGQLEWETWVTQACIDNPADCAQQKRLNQSLLRNANHAVTPKRTGVAAP